LDDGRTILAEGGEWGEAGELAGSLRKSLSQPTPGRSIWEMKLCVALCHFKAPADVVAEMSSDASSEVLLDELLDLFERDAARQLSCEALARLAIPRTALPRALFLEMTRELASLDRDLISSYLLDWHGDRFALHPLVRDAVVEKAKDLRRRESDHPWRLRRAEREAWHRRLKAEYPLLNGSTLRDELESLHHDLLGGNPDFADSDARLHFVEQLHEIGRTLSYVHRHHERAAEVFRIALRFDADQLWSVPFRHDCQHMSPCETTRQAIRDDRCPHNQGRIDPGLTATTAALDRHVMVAFDRSGAIRDLRHGLGAVTVKNEGAS